MEVNKDKPTAIQLLFGEETRIATSSRRWDWTGFDSNTYDRFRPCRTHQARLESFIAGESILNRKKRESNGSQQRQSNSYSALIRRRDSNRNVISKVRLNRVRFQHLRPVSSLSDSSGKTGIVHCRRINSQSKEERKQWKSTKTNQQLFSSYSEKRLESQCHLEGWDWTGFDSNTYDRFRPCRTHQAIEEDEEGDVFFSDVKLDWNSSALSRTSKNKWKCF